MGRLEDTQLLEGIQCSNRVIEKRVFIQDASCAVDHLVFGSGHFKPESVYALIGAEKAMRPDINQLVPEVDGARHAADLRSRLVYINGNPGFGRW